MWQEKGNTRAEISWILMSFRCWKKKKALQCSIKQWLPGKDFLIILFRERPMYDEPTCCLPTSAYFVCHPTRKWPRELYFLHPWVPKTYFSAGRLRNKGYGKNRNVDSFVPSYVPILIFAFVPYSPYPAIPHRIFTLSLART